MLIIIIGHLWNGWKKIYCVVLQGGYDPVMHAGEYCLGASFQHRVPPKCLIESAHMMIMFQTIELYRVVFLTAPLKN